ncbi:MAG TPA: hypothetical protein VGW30_08385 [Gaiellaceae bacterium]|nr:hypothetical protein [Gaiellaceae bacterium]
MVAAPTSLPARVLRRERLVARIDAAAISLLAGLIGLSVAVRLAVGWLRATPSYFADEYLYAEMARSLVETGRPTIRGADAVFPSLLQPILTAPTWLASDVWISYRLTQAIGAVAMSLVGVPVFVLARKLGLGRSTALAAAALSLAVPDLLFASWVMAEPFAYPLFVGSVLAGSLAIAEPRRRNGVAFVVLAGLTAFARAQFAVLPFCFVAAVLIVGLRERRLRATLREQALPLGLFGAAGLLVALVGVKRVLGLYQGVLDGRVDPVELAERVGLNAFVLAYSSGWILVPGALLGLALALGRPRSRLELAFGALFVTTTAALLLESGLAGRVDQAQERYVFYVLPLAVLAFCAYAARGWPARNHLALLVSLLIAASAQVPLAGFTAAEGKSQSPFLLAAFRLEEAAGSPGSGSLLIAAAAAVFGVALILLSARPSIGTPVALAVALAATTAASAGAVVFDTRNADGVRAAYLPDEPSWVDRAGVGDVTMVRAPDGVRTEAMEQLFWNRSIRRVVLLPGAGEVDHFASPRLTVAPDGRLLEGKRAVEGPVLVDGYGGTITLAGAKALASSQSYTLWRPNGSARLSLYLAGRYSDGWLAGAGRMYLWPERRGEPIGRRVSLTLAAPPAAEGMTIRFQELGKPLRAVRLEPNRPQTVTFDVCSRVAWHVTYLSSVRGFVGTRVVSAQASEARVTPIVCSSEPRRAPAALPTERV